MRVLFIGIFFAVGCSSASFSTSALEDPSDGDAIAPSMDDADGGQAADAAATLDGGQTADGGLAADAVDAAATGDAGLRDAAAPDVGPVVDRAPSTTGFSCGSATCVRGEECCVRAGSLPQVLAAFLTCAGALYWCSEADQCDSGYGCYGGAGGTTCRSGPNPGESQICGRSDECAPGLFCRPAFMVGSVPWGICAP